MEPTYRVGSIIYVKDIDPQELKEKDPVTYVLNGSTVVTHRIIEVIEGENDQAAIVLCAYAIQADTFLNTEEGVRAAWNAVKDVETP